MGMECDKLNMNTTSMFFVGEYLCLMFYYTFYRVLFESIPDWSTFFILVFCHLFFEWVCYPLRASDTFNACLSKHRNKENSDDGSSSGSSIKSASKIVGKVLEAFFFPYGLDFVDWQYFIALDFGIRCFIIVASGVSFTMSVLSVSFFPWVTNELAESGAQLLFTLALVAVSVALEVANALFLNYVFFRKKNLNVFAVVIDCFQDNRFAFITTILGAILIINPIYAFTTDNNF